MKQRRILQSGSQGFYGPSPPHLIPSKLTLMLLAFLTFLNITKAQNSTESFNAKIWGELGSKLVDLGDLNGLTGLEVNFWMLPQRNNNNENTTTLMKFLNFIQVDYQLYLSPTTVPGNALLLKYGGKTYNGTFPLYNPSRWLNVNMRVQFATYITLSVWNGIYNVETAPDFSLTHANPQAFTNASMELFNMTDDLYAYLAEIRVFELDSTQSWGQYFKYYHGVWPAGFEAARQYVSGYAGILYFDINNKTKSEPNTMIHTYEVERCLYGASIGTKVGAGLGQAYMTNYQCNPCAETDCQICPANYQGTCKVCSNSKTTVCKKDTIVCPFDYFALNGLCYRCPPGCKGCTSLRNCTDCDDGLVVATNLTHRICKCPDGKYGVPNYATDQLTCGNCNQDYCQYCENSATFCTQCFKSKNLFLYESKCVANCKAQLIPSYTSVTDQKCYACGQYCQDCVNGTYCNSKKCQWDWGDPNGVIAYNHNGVCKTQCPDNSLPNTVSQTCDDCGKNCAVCVGITENCTVCQLGYVLDNAKCISKCPPGKYPDTSNVCQICPQQCILCEAASQCTKCKNLGPGFPLDSYYFVNYQCVLECPDRYYKDGSDPWDLFCRSCPSGCNQCTDENTCTVCDIGWYLDSFYGGTRKLCVSKCQPGYYPDNTTMTCQPCLSGCQRCDNSTHCTKCFGGKVLEMVAGAPQCLDTCPDNTYPDYENVCQDCITGCKRCNNNHTCLECKTGQYLVDGPQTCVSGSCPLGYYMSGGNCLKCRSQCRTCSAALTCDTCIVGYEFKTGQCNFKCGNKVREDDEECDDGNNEAEDGCSPTCKLEPGFTCAPLDVTTAGPDVCFCDAKFQSASWTAYWGQIEIVFASNIVYNSANGPKNADAKLFCSQILDPIMLADNKLGTDYSCFLDASATKSTIRINVDLDSTLGNNLMNFTTQVTLLMDALRVKDCPTSIPLTYILTNLPLDSPIVYFQTSHNGLVVPKCSSYWGLNIFTSKGFTKRNVAVTWILLSMSPDDSDLKAELQEYLDQNYKDVKFFEFNADQIERLAGKALTIKVVVQNFLGITGSNTTTVQFSNAKSMLLVDLQDIYTFETAVDNTLAPRVRIPYCSIDNANLQETDLQQVNIICTLYSADLLKKTNMPNCTIKAFNMTLGSPYKVKIQAINQKDPNMGVTKWVHIDTASPNARIAYIEGCNRLFSVNSSFDLEAMIPTNVSFAKFNWYCTDTSTGSPCFTTTFSYITMANTKRVTIPGGQLFSNNTYLFKVIVFDELSQTETTKTCNMYAAPVEDKVLDIIIDTEANRNGFIDFNAQMAAFKVRYIGTENINKNLLTFKWKFTDSSGTVFKQNDMSIYQNSMGVLISKLERSNVYKVEVNATYGQQKGYIRTFYETEPQMSFEFAVEPTSGEPHKTVFTFSVTSQDTVDGLFQYVFGYVNPVDKISNIPIYQKSTNRYQRTQLPVPEGQTYLTCYAQVLLPSGESKTYQQNVTLTFPTITVDEFKQQLNNAVMDDLVESMQIRNKLVTLSSRMTLADRSLALRQMLKGLQKENTPLSDYNIQSSVASLLEYVSKETQSLLTDGQIVTVAANIFQQMTIGENKEIANGRYSQFGRAATFSLYNFANNIFQMDLSSAIDGNKQKEIKVMFMQGLQNVLKGSLSNSILGDKGGGFFFQGQNVYVKAIKFDQLEASYTINASLPVSLNNTMIQNFINISLPLTDDNPCKGREACQISIIILDSPINPFMSNSKDAKLMSIFVDMSIQETEVSSPYSYVQIKDIAVQDLVTPILITIPLLREFTDTTNNRTLGCGYIDPADQIFKADGVKAQMINRRLVTCQASHLTQIGVEELAVERQSIADDSAIVVQNTTASILLEDEALQVVDMWSSWAVYNNFIMMGVLVGGIVWGYSRDKRDELNLRKVFMNKEKIYMSLFLEPLPDDELAKLDDDDDYEAIQQEKARRLEEKKKKLEERSEKYRGAKIDMNAPVKGLFSPEEMEAKFGIKVEAPSETLAAQDAEEGGKKKKKKKKKPKTVSAAAVNADMFFEGGSQYSSESELPEWVGDDVELEGGSDEENKLDDGEDEAAQSVKQKGKKKKKKKKKADTLKSNQLNEGDTFKEADTIIEAPSAQPKIEADTTPIQNKQATDLMIEDLDGNKSVKSKRSRSKSLTKKKTKKKNKKQGETVELPPEEDIQINPVSLTNFVQPQPEVTPDIPQVVASDQQLDDQQNAEALPEAGETTSRRSKKGSKRKDRGGRSSSAHRQKALEEDPDIDDPNNHLKPDIEAEEISPTKKREPVPLGINREDLFKPISEYEREKLNQSVSPDKSASKHLLDDEKSVKTGKKLKKKKTKKLKKKKKEESSEEEDDDDDVNEEEEEAKKQKERDEDEEPSGCCQFCFWNFREGHRCLSFFSYYNHELNRPSRWVILSMSWYLFQAFSGFFMGGPEYLGSKTVRAEQFVCGFMAALFVRPWILMVTWLMMHPKPNKILELIENKIKANREIRNNNFRYWCGIGVVVITNLFCFIESFSLSSDYNTGLVQNWAWSFLFAIIADFIIVDGIFMMVVTIITINVGAAPDACGRKRAFWLKFIPPAVKDSIE